MADLGRFVSEFVHNVGRCRRARQAKAVSDWARGVSDSRPRLGGRNPLPSATSQQSSAGSVNESLLSGDEGVMMTRGFGRKKRVTKMNQARGKARGKTGEG